MNDEITVDVLPAASGVPWEALRGFVESIDIDGDAAAIRRALDALKSKGG